MKNIFKAILLFSLVSVIISSCQKENATATATNQQKQDIDAGCVYPIPKGNFDKPKPPTAPNNGGPVTGLTVTKLAGYDVVLKWDKYGKQSQHYQFNIYRSQVSGFVPDPNTLVGKAGGNIYTDIGLQAATTYYYRVTAYDRNGRESTPSNEVPVTTDPASTLGACILLDFDGHLETSAYWKQYNGGMPIQFAPSKLTPNQQAMKVDTMKDDYARWDVIITTEEAVFQAANPYKRQRAVITGTSNWFGNSAGGLATLTSFTNGTGTSCLVFDSLLHYSDKYVQEALAHEVGHTLGLSHHVILGTTTELMCKIMYPYDYGSNGFAPIMGVGYSQPIVTFTKGPTSCTTWQDDNAIIDKILPIK